MNTLWGYIWPSLSVLAVIVIILLEDMYEAGLIFQEQ